MVPNTQHKKSSIVTPVDWHSFMVAEGEVDVLSRQVFLKEISDVVHDVELVVTRLVPNIVSREIPSHVHQVKLQEWQNQHAVI